MFRPGPRNLITDVAGLRVGHATCERVRTGVTVITCAAAWRAGVDVRGGGPGTREIEALAPENLVGRAHALVFAGGSVFGLAAADGVTADLSAAGVGLNLRPAPPATAPPAKAPPAKAPPAIPIVPAAVLHDLANGGDKAWGREPPYRDLGRQALAAAADDFALGSVGAGRGAMAGLHKGGVGSSSIDLGDGLIVGALVVVNSIGSAHMPDGKTYWAWPFELEHEFGGGPPPAGPQPGIGDPVPADSRLLALGRLTPGANTTLGLVANSADLDTAECKRVAMMAHDGIARALRPAHTPFDGDTLFALASGAMTPDAGTRRAAQVARIGAASADCLARAIARAVHHAK